MDKETLIKKISKDSKYIFVYENFFKRLKDFFKRNGRLPKQRDRDLDGYPLGAKIDCIRQKVITLTPKQIKELEDFGLKTTITPKNNPFIFNKFLNRVIDFKKRNGRFPHSGDKDIDGYPIGTKVFDILRRNIKLSPEQYESLKNLNIELKTYDEYQFEDFCFRFKRAYEHLGRSPKVSDPDPFDPNYKLGRMIASYRKKYDTLTKKQKSLLDSVGFDSYENLALEEFCKNFETASAFYKRPPKTIEKGPIKNYNIGKKMIYYRLKFKSLTKEQQNKLLSVGFQPKYNKEDEFDYDLFLEKIKDFKEKYHRNPTAQDYEKQTNYAIGQIIIDIAENKIKLTLNQKAELISLGIELPYTPTTQSRISFDDFFLRLCLYKQKHNSFPPKDYVAEDGFPLGYKLHQIITNDIILKPENKELLENLGVIFKMKTKEKNNNFFLERLEYFVKTFNRLPNRNENDPENSSYRLGQKFYAVIHKNQKLTKEQKERLVNLIKNYSKPKTLDFELYIKRLKKFIKKFETFPTGKDKYPKDYSIGKITDNIIKGIYNLTTEQINELVTLNFPFANLSNSDTNKNAFSD